mmetsp:Transcript_33647/g.87278  ORF Transcript_33647/g.87278 Transcript_33647/m.87278 type:complete len:136 (-) Transcript_33647:496-903(-)
MRRAPSTSWNIDHSPRTAPVIHPKGACSIPNVLVPIAQSAAHMLSATVSNKRHIDMKGRATTMANGAKSTRRNVASRVSSRTTAINNGDLPKRYVNKIDSRTFVCSSSQWMKGKYILPTTFLSIVLRKGTFLYKS